MLIFNGSRRLIFCINVRSQARNVCSLRECSQPPSFPVNKRRSHTTFAIAEMDDLSNPNTFSANKMDRNQYVYTPLDSTQDSIRLLRLFPSADPDAPIQCTLFPVSLGSAPSYTALSYAWGATTSRRNIELDNSTMAVTPSLNHALQRLRSEVGERLLWIDALSIDQSNVSERNIQISKMRSIYQNAESVAVWLGTEYNESREALRLAKDINLCTSPQEIKNLLVDQEQDLIALVRLLRRQYWWRIWVVQEVTCGRRRMVYCGDEEITWDKLDNVCNILKEHQPFLLKLFYKNQSYVRTLIAGGPKGLQISRYSPNNPAPPLLELLSSHKGKKSTEPKDKVFALIGISSSRYTFGKIDYSSSVRDVYSHTARHIISTTGRLDVICLKQHHIPEYNLPSWAPNWVRAPSSVPLSAGATLIGLHHHEPPFQASGNTMATAEFLSDGYVLKVTGIVIDTITKVGMPFLRKGSPADPLPPLRAFHHWWNLFTKSHSDSLQEQAVFGRTLSCGNWRFENEEEHALKLDSIFSLSEDRLADDDTFMSNPPSRAQSHLISRTSTMSGSVASLLDDENEDDGLYGEEKEQLGTILSASLTMNRRRLVISETGFVGLGLWNADVGDVICVLLGCRFPVIMRKTGDHYILVGEAYIDGIMEGEALEGLKDGKYELESFEIH